MIHTTQEITTKQLRKHILDKYTTTLLRVMKRIRKNRQNRQSSQWRINLIPAFSFAIIMMVVMSATRVHAEDDDLSQNQERTQESKEHERSSEVWNFRNDFRREEHGKENSVPNVRRSDESAPQNTTTKVNDNNTTKDIDNRTKRTTQPTDNAQSTDAATSESRSATPQPYEATNNTNDSTKSIDKTTKISTKTSETNNTDKDNKNNNTVNLTRIEQRDNIRDNILDNNMRDDTIHDPRASSPNSSGNDRDNTAPLQVRPTQSNTSNNTELTPELPTNTHRSFLAQVLTWLGLVR